MNKQLVESATCKIDCDGEKGSGFFISRDKIITCRHVLTRHLHIKTKEIKITAGSSSFECTARLIAHCETTDLALLDCEGNYESEHTLVISSSPILDDEDIYSYGYPNTNDGRLVGEPLHGTVLRTITNSTATIRDVSLTIDNFSKSKEYEGFSGSPVVNGRGVVTSVLSFENKNYLSSMSINKAKGFLLENNIIVEDNELETFISYRDDAFKGFSYLKDECENYSNSASNKVTPSGVIKTNGGELFYPRKQMSFDEIKVFLRENQNIDSCLWTGWIQFLTYMNFLEVDYSNLKDVRVKLETAKFKIPFFKTGLKTITYDLKLKLFYTEEDDYLDLARNYMSKNKDKMRLEGNSCHIFNSHVPNFGKISIDPSNIIDDVANPKGSTFSPEMPKIGIVSLEQLSQIVMSSQTSDEAVIKIKKKLEDVII
ncbi:serine protease [Vibrio splendidus]|uniref:S1 family peptidase n=1 Tax=Vibrio splendidus TaxID=29497 RepID=UPI0002F8FE8C|nr:serine protease [Vibrio splendidus]OEF78595.1 hypothetical protein A148_14070 [Vibrio splendidus 1F-157]